MALLKADGINSQYIPQSLVLKGISLSIDEGEIRSVLGRNGAGKTTLFRTLMGVLIPSDGEITFDEEDITEQPSYKRSKNGIGLVPQDKRIFDELTVKENNELGKLNRSEDVWFTQELYEDLFHELTEREDVPASFLSGGERQMLALSRCFFGQPKLVMVDEPCEGLAPKIREGIKDIISELKRKKKMSFIIAENNLDFCLKLADYHYVLHNGEIKIEGDDNVIEDNLEEVKRYLSI